MVPFLASYVTANMVPLLSTAFATGGDEADEPVARGVLDDPVACEPVASGLVELFVALAFTVTDARVNFEWCAVEEAWAAAALVVAFIVDDPEAGAVLKGTAERPVPVACATPDAVVLLAKSATVPVARAAEAVEGSSSTTSVMLLPRETSVVDALALARVDDGRAKYICMSSEVEADAAATVTFEDEVTGTAVALAADMPVTTTAVPVAATPPTTPLVVLLAYGPCEGDES